MLNTYNISYNIKEECINTLLSKSKYQILNFKKDLYKLYKLIFKFCSDNNIIISNYNINISKYEQQIYKLIDLDQDFKFNLISINPYKDAINLSNLLYKNYSKYIVMSSYLRNKEIIISIDNDKIIKIHLLFLFMTDDLSINSQDKLKHIKLNKFNFKFDNEEYKLQYSNDLLELLQLTHKLYNPSEFLKFYKSNNKNSLIFVKLIKSLLDTNTITGIGKQNIPLPVSVIINKDEKGFNNTLLPITVMGENIRKYLIENIYQDSYSQIQILLLDTYAIQSILNNSLDINNFNYNFPLQIIINSKYLELILTLLNNYIKSNLDSKKINLITKTNIIYIMNDFRLVRKNIILFNKETNKKTTILYVYNSLDYEIIPTIIEKKNLYIPHSLVIIRFLIINLYYMQLFDPSYDQYSYNIFIQKINDLISNIDNYLIKKYNIINYIGTFIDERIDKFKLNSSIYRPWQYETKFNKLL